MLAACATDPPSTPQSTTAAPPTQEQATLTPRPEPMPTEVFQRSEAEVAAWLEDLDVFREQLPQIHPNPYWRVPEDEYDRALEALQDDLPGMTDTEVILGLARIVAFIDGHSAISLFAEPVNFQMYPLRLYLFSDGLYVIDAQEPYAAAVGGRVTHIGKLPIEEAIEAITPYIPHDNPMTIQTGIANWLLRPEALQTLGIIDFHAQPEYKIADPDGSEQIFNPPPISWEDYRAWSGGSAFGLPERPEPPFLSRAFSEDYWFTFLEDSETLYIQFNRVRPGTDRMAREIQEFLDGQDVERVVLDMRLNFGGDNTTFRSFLNFLSTDSRVNRPGRFFTILGRQTFSAAANFATELENRTHTIFVGEPMGGSPNLYGDVHSIFLPNSGVRVNVSSRYWEMSTPEDNRLSIEPDLPVDFSSGDFFSGHDPVLEVILAMDPSEAIGGGVHSVLSPLAGGTWEGDDIRDPYVVAEDGQYYMFYSGRDAAGVPAIGYATSDNGKKWFRADNNPVLVGDGNGFDAAGVAAPVVLREGDLWVMYYGGVAEPGGRTRAIGRAEAASPEGPWVRAEAPVLEAGEGLAWDSLSITPGSVVDTGDGLRLYYSGFSEAQVIGVGFAESTDGVTWTKHNLDETTERAYAASDPVLPGGGPGQWDEIVWAPFVHQTNGQWEMIYHGDPISARHSLAIGLGAATSSDGVEWARPDEPFVTSPDENYFPHTPAMILVGEMEFVYFALVGAGGQTSEIYREILPR